MREINELEIFEAVHGKPLLPGAKVFVEDSNPYADEWRGEFLVLGINWDRHRNDWNVTIGEDWKDGGADGWKPSDLRPAI